MLCCPDRSPLSRWRRFPGGIANSRRSRTRLTCVSFRRATGQTETGQAFRARALSTPLKRSSVAVLANERITVSIITDTVGAHQYWPGLRRRHAEHDRQERVASLRDDVQPRLDERWKAE